MGISEAVAEGRTIWMQTGCSGCHGMGGGGMGPSVMDDQWKFGGEDEAVLKLIKGSIQGQTMPNVFGLLLKDEQIWKIIAWVRSIYKGDPNLIVW
jgi:mono/diheme cytochrome c family protein